jgi:hypothetical protein
MTLVLATIIKRLRDNAPTFQKRVGGTSAFQEAALEDVDIPLPHAFVVPLTDNASPPANMGGSQRIEERFAVILCVDNKTNREDGVGMIAADVLRSLRQELFNSLLGWAPQETMDNTQYVGGRHLSMTRSRLWHQYEFKTAYFVSGAEPGQTGEETCVPLAQFYTRTTAPGSPPRQPGLDDFDTLEP